MDSPHLVVVKELRDEESVEEKNIQKKLRGRQEDLLLKSGIVVVS
jgi:hypothetical protein